ncbi:P-loop containing nucleoside triphosphate hydrolase protein [Boletus edulis BED1]|uniref:P-loop containing nucleoside triphosphate hydrolase protein n=1 Tax=Boletus edulis BED1 TaxID=1328754 RepID=A0AAD4BD01_BOLED|nr:P-loop containing nucleoside triphosphate hydrolase protein [Boletus edulis BED1]
MKTGNLDSDSDVVVGLSDSSNSQHRKDMLELINRLHDTGVQTDIDLPMIAVIGSQSAGKSSLIESISGITLPRSAGTCTRCPTECKLSHSDLPWSCDIKLHFHTDSMGVPIPVCLVPFGSPITSKSLVEDRIRRAQRAILNPSQKPDDYLHDGFPEENELSFSKNYVSLEISGKDLADLSFVDLPGLIASVGARGDDRDIELVKSLVTSYIEKPSCVILLTVACETDFENQGAYHLAKSFDPQGKRTVGVLTKPDRIPAGEEHRWLKIIRNETEPLVNNWYCVRQPSSQVLSKGITWAEARRREEDYFTITPPWCSLESQYQNYLRTRNLTERLSIILSELVAKRLPEIQDELVNTIRETEAEISKLPRAPSNDPVSEVMQALSAFSRELSRRVEGTPDENGLLQTIRPHQQAFRRAIRSTAPNFVPWEEKKAGKKLPKAEFLQDEEGEAEEAEEAEEEENQTRPAKKIRIEQHIHIDEVLERAASACTRELPDSYPFVVQQAFIKEFTIKWRQPSMDLFDRVYTILKVDVDRLVEEHFAHMGKGLAKQSVLMIVNDHLDRAAIQSKAKIEWLLSLEQVPTTLNAHYFSDYKDKFLAFYRARRNNNDLMLKLKQAETTSQIQSTSTQQSPHKRGTVFSSDASQRDAATDLAKLSPPDPMEQALHIMASVRGYFQVAYKRFADMVPMAIDHEIILGLQRGIDEALREGLQITGPDGYSRCKSIVEEFSTIASTRQELQKKMERLQAARQELRKLM